MNKNYAQMNKNYARLLLAWLWLFACGLAGAQTLNPTADAYVAGGTNASKNFGNATTLQVQTNATAAKNFDSYLKFDLSAVGAFSAAKLRVYAALSNTGSVTTSVYAVANTTWGETTITWNNKPPLGAALASKSVVNKTFAWYEFDVTSYLASERAAGRNVVTLALHAPSASALLLKANSRQATTNKPQLVLTPDTAPGVSLTAPANGASYIAPASITLSASASDPDGTVQKVDFLQGGTLIATVTAAPYTYNWSNVAAGSYTLTARATDNFGVTTTSAPVSITVVPNSAPSVSLTAPANGASYIAPASITLSASASDPDGTVQKVDFLQGGTLIATVTAAPYTYTWSNVGTGSYTLTARATDNLGATTTSAPVSITVVQNSPPSVTLTAPASGTSYAAPAAITLSASASDADGTIQKVDFLQGGSLIASVTAAPYTYNWSNVGAGSYTLTARATDNLGATTTSAAVNVTVTAQPPALYYIHTDQLNTPRMITDQAQQVVWRWDNDDPFGGNMASDNPNGNGSFIFNLRFPGQYFDRETGLHYNYFRDYDPSTGRYVESDPIGLKGGINTYAYVDANPAQVSDPAGLFAPPLTPLPPHPITYAFLAGALTGAIVYAAFDTKIQDALEKIIPYDPASHDPSLQKEIEFEANKREYKRRCNEPPPPGLDPCELARWNLKKARDCKAMRNANTERWWGGTDTRHDPQLAEDLDRAIDNAEKAVQRACRTCP